MKIYLGDGAYAEWNPDRGGLVVTAEDGICATDTIVLGPHEWEMLVQFMSRIAMPDTGSRR